jgi:hypothetical protein
MEWRRAGSRNRFSAVDVAPVEALLDFDLGCIVMNVATLQREDLARSHPGEDREMRNQPLARLERGDIEFNLLLG